MLEITWRQLDSVTILHLAGRLVGPWVDEFERTFERLSRDGAVRLDLDGLSFADDVGAATLRRCMQACGNAERCAAEPTDCDRAPGEALVRAHGGALFARAMRLLGEPGEATAAVESTFGAALGSMPELAPGATARAWLLRSLTAAVLRGDRDSIAAWLPEFTADGHWAEHPGRGHGNRGAGPARPSRARLHDAVRRLPADHRAIVRLRDIEGLDAEATAVLVDLPIEVVEARLHRARMALCTLLGDERFSA